MLSISNLTLQFGKDILFEDVNIKFTGNHCYGVIGANGAGKSTFLKILSNQIPATKGSVIVEQGKRLSFLEQDQFKYDEFTVIDTVIRGNQKLFDIMNEKNSLYMKPDFNEEDGIKAGELEAIFDEMDGWNAESNASILLNGLGVDTIFHDQKMHELPSNQKVKVLLAKALFGNPDILLLDEPTNHLDIEAIQWLENFLINFDQTVIVVSHDRYFLNKVCTHIADIDYKQITLYPGNYDFWYESSQLLIKQMKEQNKKSEEKIKELQEFIARFSANASKSKQATSRKKALEKIEVTEIKPSSRRYPYINFKIEKPLGQEIISFENVSKVVEGMTILKEVSFTIGPEDKVAFVGKNQKAITMLFDLIAGKQAPDSGKIKVGATVRMGYFEKDHGYLFEKPVMMTDWLSTYSDNQEQTYIRGFLGRMLFSGEDALKNVSVLSGGEKVRLLLSSLMIQNVNMLVLDEPTNHLDMDSITALNKGLMEFTGVLLLRSQDHQLVETSTFKIIHIDDEGVLTLHHQNYEAYLESQVK